MLGIIFLAASLAFSLGAALSFAVKSARWGRIFACLSGAGVFAAGGYLMALILNNRFDIEYVAGYSSIELPLLYKISVFWAGQQGSFLFWLLVHACAGAALVWKERMNKEGLAVYLLIQSLLIALVLAKSPFTPMETAVRDGVGLNPLLQNFWMAVHPPLVFIGYALLAVPFSYSAGALLAGDFSGAWLKAARRWALVGWGFLGAGIFIGGYWAYKVLGWGGYWGWDPVENSSLVPWLLTLIFVHVLKVAEIRRAALFLVHFSAIFVFSSALYGTFLTRSGVLGDFSVHSFSGTDIGAGIAAVNAFVLIAALVLLTVRINRLPQGEMYSSYAGREFAMLLGMLLIAFIAAVVFLGMSMPLLTQLAGRPASVDVSFYTRGTMPPAVLFMALLAASCLYFYGGRSALSKKMKILLSAAFLFGSAAASAAGVREIAPVVLAGASAAAFAASLCALRERRIGFGAAVSHMGAGMALLAVVLSGSGSQSVSQEFVLDEPVNLLGHEIEYKGQKTDFAAKEKYYVYEVDGQEITAFTKLRANGEDAAREPAVKSGFAGDVYIAPSAQKGERTEVILEHGRTVMDGAFAYRYEDIDIEQRSGGEFAVTADVAVTDGEAVEHARPSILATEYGGMSQPIEIFGGQKRIRLTGISGDQRQARIEIMPSAAEESALPLAAAVSVKPFIWLLWLGCGFVVCGCWLAAGYR